MKIKTPLLTLAVCLALLFTSALRAQDTTSLKIIVTTDLHGHILPHDLLENRARNHSLAHVYAYIQNERANPNQEVILLDNGDLLQGDPFIYYYNFVDTAGVHPLAQVMNFMKYDAAAVGNHDIEAGPAVYNKLTEQFNFPYLGANIVDESTGKPFFKPYTIIEKNNKKIAILGLCTPSIPQWLPRELWQGLVFRDMVETAREWVRYINSNENPDVLIGLFHSGAQETDISDGIPEYLEQASRVIAQEVIEFDAVFTGHDHRRYNEFVPNAAQGYTLLLAGGTLGRGVAVANISIIDDPEMQAVYKDIYGELVDVTSLSPDRAFLSRFEELLDPVKEFINQPVTSLRDSLFSRDALFGSADFVNIIHHIQLDISGADISFCAPLSFDAVIPSGKINRGELFKLYRYENQLYTMNLSGKEVLAALEYSYGNWMNQMNSRNDNLLNFVRNDEGELFLNAYGRLQTATPYFNYESAAGIVYTVDVSKPAGGRVKIESMINGQPFNPDHIYKVSINSYRGSGGGGHLTEGAGIPHDELQNRISWTSGQDLRFMIMEWLKNNTLPEKITAVQWQVIPESWHARGKARDSELLFKK